MTRPGRPSALPYDARVAERGLVHASAASARVTRVVRVAVGVALVASTTWIFADRVANRTWSERLPAATIAHGSVPDRLLRSIRDDGVRVDDRVATALQALVGEWTTRPDLRSLYTTADGLPDVQALLSWAASSPDSSAYRLLPYRNSLDELGYRMAILPPNGDIVPVLGWTLRNRERPVQDATPSLIRLADTWKARPDIRERFTLNGRIRVRALLFWAANVTPDDPDFTALYEVAPQLAQLVAEYRGPTS